MNSGVYEIFNTVNGKRYIGSSKNIENRWKRHRADLRNGDHHCVPLQRAWNKYGPDKIIFKVILTCAPTRQMLKFYEQQLLSKVNPEYNILQFADSRLGAKASEQTKQKMSESQKQRHAAKGGMSVETKKRIGAANKIHAANRSALITHCPRGHEYTEENTYHGAHNSRSCRTCARELERERKIRKRQQAIMNQHA